MAAIRMAAIMMMLIVSGLTWSLPVSAHAAAPPALSITIDDGQTSAKPKDQLDYTIILTNLGGRKIRGLLITQQIPDGAELISADPRGKERSGTVTWEVDVAAGQPVTVRSKLRVDASPPAELLRLAAVACARTEAKGHPVVCASDSDQLPAGAALDQRQPDAEPPDAADRPSWTVSAAIAAGAAGLLALVVLSAVAISRRRRTQALNRADRAEDEHQELVSR